MKIQRVVLLLEDGRAATPGFDIGDQISYIDGHGCIGLVLAIAAYAARVEVLVSCRLTTGEFIDRWFTDDRLTAVPKPPAPSDPQEPA
jgi:hypothetical protein